MVVDEKGQIAGCDHLTGADGEALPKKAPGSAVVFDSVEPAVAEEITRAVAFRCVVASGTCS